MSRVPSGTEVQLQDESHLIFVHRGPPGDKVISVEQALDVVRTPSGTEIYHMSALNLIKTGLRIYGVKRLYKEVWRGPEIDIQRVEYPQTVKPLERTDIDLLQAVSHAAGSMRAENR